MKATTYRHGIEVNMSLIAIQINNNKNNKNISDVLTNRKKKRRIKMAEENTCQAIFVPTDRPKKHRA